MATYDFILKNCDNNNIEKVKAAILAIYPNAVFRQDGEEYLVSIETNEDLDAVQNKINAVLAQLNVQAVYRKPKSKLKP